MEGRKEEADIQRAAGIWEHTNLRLILLSTNF